MKKLRAMALIYSWGCSLFLAYRFSQSPGPARAARNPRKQPMHIVIKASGNNIYNPVGSSPEPCISVTGAVEEVRKEADGDVHIRFHLDQQFTAS